ncbi:MAG: CCDC90 family protein [Magnetococcus sp. MYC-9]
MSTATGAESGYKGASFVFDSYAYVRRLRDAGMDEQQAAIQAETFMALAEDRLATKQDIAELMRDIAAMDAKAETTKAELHKAIEITRAELRKDIEAIRAELHKDIEAIRAELRKDIDTTRTELHKDIEITRAELRKDIETAKVETIKWVVITGIAILGGVAALIRFVPPVPAYYQPSTQEMRQTAPVPAPPLAPQGPPAHSPTPAR